MEETTDLATKTAFIRKQACFKPLTDKETMDLAQLLAEKTFKAGETIVTEGDHVDSVYLIVQGSADVRKAAVGKNGLESHSVATLHAGEAIGLNETGFYSLTGLRTATVVALTDMTLLYLNIASFNGFALANSHVHAVMRKNAEETRNNDKE
ncbi:MAG: cyclic nucleotide-binding domain-containing protein [Gammaproteobacteria bacterium]|nr:cyclic nucleotide-binding domain-containing protein [Gammaproteobacteria bacterium]